LHVGFVMALVQVANIVAGRWLAKDHVHFQEFLDHVLFVFCPLSEGDHPLLDSLRSEDRPRQGLLVSGFPTPREPLRRRPDVAHGLEVDAPVGSAEDVEDEGDLSPSDLRMRRIEHSRALQLAAYARMGELFNSDALTIPTVTLKRSIEFLIVLCRRIFVIELSICVCQRGVVFYTVVPAQIMEGHHSELASQKISTVRDKPCERIRESESMLKTMYHLTRCDVEAVSGKIAMIGQHIECRTRRSLLIMCWNLEWVRGLVVCSNVTRLSDGTERNDEHKDMLGKLYGKDH